MANIKNFGLVGLGSGVQFGKGGAQIISQNGTFAAKSTDGSAFVRFQVAAPTGSDDASTKNYVDGLISTVNTDVSGLQTELTTVVGAAGLGATGTFIVPASSHYLGSATSLSGSDSLLDAAIFAEVGRATAAEGVNTAAIAAETTRATAAEGVNAAAITAETTRATAAEGVNAAAITAETTRAEAAEAAGTAALAAEATRATTAEQANATALTAETTRATAAEGVNATAISAETTRATAAEAAASGAISAIETAAGLDVNGHYVADAGSNYLGTATSLANADHLLDTALAAANANIATNAANIATNTSNIAANAAAGSANAAAITAADGRLTAIEGDYVKKDGSVAFTGSINAGGNKLINLVVPTDVADAATKGYVDTAISGLGAAFQYVGTVDGGTEASPTNLTTLTKKATGDYYKVTTAGYFTDGTTTFMAQKNDGIVVNPAGGFDTIAHVDSVTTGTASRIAVAGTVDTGFTVDIDAAYAGQASITTVGTIGTGTWAGTTIDTAHGGTGQTAFSAGELLVGNAASGLSALALGTPDQLLRVKTDGTGLEYHTVVASDIASTNADFNGANLDAVLTQIGTRLSNDEAASTALTYVMAAVVASAGLNGDGTKPAYTSTNFVAAGDTLVTAVDKLDAEAEVLATGLSAETTRATAAEGVNAAAIAAETSRATAAEGVNAASITAETTRATTAELANATAITAETTRATAAEATNAAAITAETTRATAAEGVNAAAITAETTRATAAEGVNAAAITAETARAEAAGAANSARIATNSTAITAIETSVGLNTDGTFTAPTGTNYLGAITTVMGGLTTLDTQVEDVNARLNTLSQDEIKSATTGLVSVKAAETGVVFNANVNGTKTQVGSVVGGNSTNSSFVIDTTVAGAVEFKALSSTATDVDIRLVPQGAGHVLVGDAGAGILQADDGYDLTLAGGDNSSGAGGNLILRGGNGSSTTGLVEINDASGNAVMTFTGSATPNSGLTVSNGAGVASIAASGSTSNIDLVLSAKGTGVVNVSGARVASVATPTVATDAANKGYVDTSVATAVRTAVTGAVVTRVVALSETTGTVNVGALVSGTVLRVRVVVSTPFTSGASISVGSTGGASELMDSTLVDETATGIYETNVSMTYAGTQLTASVTAGSGTTGVASVIVEYISA